MKAVIQSGGKGTRLMPYTMVLPKPLMPVGSSPVLSLLLNWLRRNSVREVFITTGYLGSLIQALIGNGSRWDMEIQYTSESEPLGTVGALSMLSDQLGSTFLVINGDVLTDLNLSALTSYHRQQGAIVTVATVTRSLRLNFGVIEQAHGYITEFHEKPVLSHTVSMGLYCMEPQVLQYIPRGVAFGFDDLMSCLLERQVPVSAFSHEGLWLDIGRVEDFKKAQELPWEDQPPAYNRVANRAAAAAE
jgi:NDP-sugar pyrophosphorylase family protein